MKRFWSSRNSCGVGGMLPPMATGGAGATASAPIEISSGVEDSVTHISETRLDDSVAEPAKQQCSDASVLSPEEPSDAANVSKRRGRKRKAAAVTTDASSATKRKQVAPTTITRRWQTVWACKFK